MSDERADLILNMLRAIRGKQDQHDQKFDEVITRLSALERDFAGIKLDFAGVHARLNNIGRRLARVERRLELVDDLPPELIVFGRAGCAKSGIGPNPIASAPRIRPDWSRR